MPLKLKIPLAILVLAGAALIATYRYLPVNRVAVTSELVMLGDLNGDNQWNMKDQEILSGVLADPFRFDRLSLLKIDVNRNELIDEEDTAFLEYL